MNQATRETIQRLLEDAVEGWQEFDTDEPINGSDLVEWFGTWRDEAKEALKLMG